MILFRADGNAKIASGHIMRCLSLADAARDQGEDCCFVVASGDFQPLIQNRGYPCVVLGTDYADMEAELPGLEALLQDWGPEDIVVDSYHVTGAYLAALRRRCVRLIYLDDLAAFPYPVDALINYGIGVSASDYEALYAGKERPEMLLGPRYAPLRREFHGLPFRSPSKVVKDILVSTGGADAEHVALRFIRRLMDVPANVRFHLVVGRANTDREEILAKAQDVPNLILHQDVREMQKLMSSCDAAVSAAGSTMYELCACSLPIITYILADNQIMGAERFAQSGAALPAGDARTRGFEESLFALLERLCRDADLRRTMAKRAYAITDGRGAERVIRRLKEGRRVNLN